MKYLISMLPVILLTACTTVPAPDSVPEDAPKVNYVPSGSWLISGEPLPTRDMTLEEYLEFIKPKSECGDKLDPVNCV